MVINLLSLLLAQTRRESLKPGCLILKDLVARLFLAVSPNNIRSKRRRGGLAVFLNNIRSKRRRGGLGVPLDNIRSERRRGGLGVPLDNIRSNRRRGGLVVSPNDIRSNGRRGGLAVSPNDIRSNGRRGGLVVSLNGIRSNGRRGGPGTPQFLYCLPEASCHSSDACGHGVPDIQNRMQMVGHEAKMQHLHLRVIVLDA